MHCQSLNKLEAPFSDESVETHGISQYFLRCAMSLALIKQPISFRRPVHEMCRFNQTEF